MKLLVVEDEYDSVILDIMLSKLSGFDVLERIRNKGIQTPILFLTARDSKKDIIHGLDLGADDYISKPFDFDELLARVRVMLRKRLKHVKISIVAVSLLSTVIIIQFFAKISQFHFLQKSFSCCCIL